MNWLPYGMPLSKLAKPFLLVVTVGVVGVLLNVFDQMERYYLVFVLVGAIMGIVAASMTAIEIARYLEEKNGDPR